MVYTKTDTIDWKEVHRRIAETPVIVPPGPSRKSIERRRRRDRERWNKYYHENTEHCHERQKEWEQANPDKVKAKRKRFYERHKLDPVWMENHRQKNREYKARKRAEKAAASRG